MFSHNIKLVKINFGFSWFDPFQLLKHIPEPSMTHESSAASETAPPWQQHFRDPPLSICALPAPSSSSYTTVVYLWIIFFPAHFFHLFNSLDQSTVSRICWAFLFERRAIIISTQSPQGTSWFIKGEFTRPFRKHSQTLLVFNPTSRPLVCSHLHANIHSPRFHTLTGTSPQGLGIPWVLYPQCNVWLDEQSPLQLTATTR